MLKKIYLLKSKKFIQDDLKTNTWKWKKKKKLYKYLENKIDTICEDKKKKIFFFFFFLIKSEKYLGERKKKKWQTWKKIGLLDYYY